MAGSSARRSRKTVGTILDVGTSKIRGVRQGAPEGTAGIGWWKISAASAAKIMAENFTGKRPPRPGYEVLVDGVYRGYGGRWGLINRAGRYELLFYQN